MRTNIDVAQLDAVLDARIESEHLSRRQAARQIGVSASLLSRLRSGQRPDLDAYVSIVHWLHMSTEDFLQPDDHAKKQPELTSAISALLRARRDLSDVEKTLLESVLASGLQMVQSIRAD
ncbi:helix-turn-helix domain-containing protein [Cryobacterium zhongshanensis]|uniref:Helix-turn-helix domain-containing protein n=1 Tax=Cryobacterium zhongshanensis TaxID=2928153 RepID=A0AA41UGY0_9MICO|nr:helix-turn-helix transcriptional regulator [Cryobacterium zhongshanensis]MCI4659677.1 helix-turn-helix domain-containing protein [Cryobacterium zhongshanensis]